MQDFNSLINLFTAFPDEQSCINHLEHLRWNGIVVSPFDPISKVYKCKDNYYRLKIRENTLMLRQILYSTVPKSNCGSGLPLFGL